MAAFESIFSKLFVVHRVLLTSNQCLKYLTADHFDSNELELLTTLSECRLKNFMKYEWAKWDTNNDSSNHEKLNKTIFKLMSLDPKVYNSAVCYKQHKSQNQLLFYHKLFTIREVVIVIFQYLDSMK